MRSAAARENHTTLALLGVTKFILLLLHCCVHTHRTSVHQAAKLVAALLRVAMVTAGLAESNGSLPPGL